MAKRGRPPKKAVEALAAPVERSESKLVLQGESCTITLDADAGSLIIERNDGVERVELGINSFGTAILYANDIIGQQTSTPVYNILKAGKKNA